MIAFAPARARGANVPRPCRYATPAKKKTHELHPFVFSVLVLLLGAPELAIAAPAAKPVGTVVGVALMPLETSADDVAAGRQILAAVRDALDTTAGFAEKGPVEMGLDEARMSFSCFDEKPGCMAQVGALVDAKFLLWGKLTKAGSALRLEIHYVDVAKGTARTETFTESEPGAVDRLGRMAAEVVVGKRIPVTGAPLGAQPARRARRSSSMACRWVRPPWTSRCPPVCTRSRSR